ncbi:MAG: ABC transporter permease [Terracidiphilus sp.]|jgi:predicted permease
MSWRRFFSRKRADADLIDEIESYIAEEMAENRMHGMSEDEAKRRARIKFGNPQRVREGLWQQNSFAVVESAWRDLKYALRTLMRTPGFTATAILVMALGIGATVALFTVVWSVLLKPLPFEDPDRLITIYENSNDQFPMNSVAPGMYKEWAKQNRSFSNLAMLGEAQFNLSTEGGELPEMLFGAACTANLLPTLGVQPALGRNFTASEDQPGSNRVVLLSWSLWKRRFGGDPAIMGRMIRLNRLSYRVIGVMPQWFAFPDSTAQLWTPIYNYFPAAYMTAVGNHQFEIIGRLKPGVAEEQARADLSVITRQVHDANLNNPFVSKAANTQPLLNDMVGDVKRRLYALLAASGCVLLIACLNVANLLVARAAARRKELAIRTALGGGRLRLLREQLMESLLLTVAGGVTGLAMAYGLVQWLGHVTFQNFGRFESIRIDGVVAAFTLTLVILCALFAGLFASASAMGNQLSTALQDGSRMVSAAQGRTRLRKSLLAAEVGLTVVLLVAAGLLMKSYLQLRYSDLGCTTKNVLTMRLNLFGGSYNDPARRVNLFAELLERVRALPGVQAAGLGRTVPGSGYPGDHDFAIVEHPPLPKGTTQYAINFDAEPGYFRAMGIPLLRGHLFDTGQRLETANETVINAAFARQYFLNEDPIGKHLRYENKNWEIVGIVGDTRSELYQDPKPIQYYPIFAGTQNSGMLVIRSGRDVEQLALPVQRAVQQLDRDLPVYNVLSMDQLLGRVTFDASFNATLLLGFAVISLLLAATGIFGVLSYIIAQRTQEIGVRMALGAKRDQVLRLMLSDGLRPALFGLVFGLAASVGAVRLIQSMLYETRPLDPAIFAAVAAILLAVASLACLMPAWRASQLDPMQALRNE